MPAVSGKLGLAFGIGIATVMSSIVGAWLFVLTAQEPLEYRLAASLPWPVACSLRGCVTTLSWFRLYAAHRAFAHAAGQSDPKSYDSLTTLLRQHLVKHAIAQSPVTSADAQRYRTEILNLSDDAALAASTGFSVQDYDRYVIIPFLEQEALRTERKAQSLDELYSALSRELTVYVLPFHVRWDTEKAAVVAQD